MQDGEKEKGKIESKDSEEETYKSFFEMDGAGEIEDDDLEDEEVREKIREQKVKSLKERRRMGDKGDGGSKRMGQKR